MGNNKTEIITKENLFLNKPLYDSLFDMWLYEFRTHLTKDEYWTPEVGETILEIENAYKKSITKFQENIAGAKYFVINVDYNDKLNGFLGLDFDDIKKTITVFNLIVTEEKRRKEIGTSLLINAIEFVKEKYDDYKLISYTNEDNYKSIALHEKMGFKTDMQLNDFNCVTMYYNKKSNTK